MTTRGFILGKFMPPHAGHVWLCQTALNLFDELTILVCTLDREPIDGKIRHEWMQKLVPDARIIWHDADVPQVPEDDPDFWQIWKRICQEAHPEPIDFVFGSEAYIERLAQELDAGSVIVDPDRFAFPVSGTQIRDCPADNWKYIPGAVRPYFQKRVVLFGPESVGKSTLAKSLAAHFNTLFVPEYGRTYTEYGGPEKWERQDFINIAARHKAMRRALAPKAGPILLEDTDPLLTCVWEEMLTGKKSNWIDEIELADLYLFLDVDIDWVDDGTRYFAQRRQQLKFKSKCLDILNQTGAKHVVISGNFDERRAAAVTATEQFFRSISGN